MDRNCRCGDNYTQFQTQKDQSSKSGTSSEQTALTMHPRALTWFQVSESFRN